MEPCSGIGYTVAAACRGGGRRLKDRVQNDDDNNLRGKDVIIVSELVSFSLVYKFMYVYTLIASSGAAVTARVMIKKRSPLFLLNGDFETGADWRRTKKKKKEKKL